VRETSRPLDGQCVADALPLIAGAETIHAELGHGIGAIADAASMQGHHPHTRGPVVELIDTLGIQARAVFEIDQHEQVRSIQQWERPIRSACDTDCHAPRVQRFYEDRVRVRAGAQEENRLAAGGIHAAPPQQAGSRSMRILSTAS